MTDALAAHYRCLAQLRDKIRTIPARTRDEASAAAHTFPRKTPDTETQRRRDAIRKLLADGIPKRRMAALVGCSRTAVQNHVRAIAKETT